MEPIVCVDIGGSKYMAGIVSADGEVLERQKYFWEPAARRHVGEQVFDAVGRLLAAHPECVGRPIGMAIPGLADPDTGYWRSAAFLKLWDYPIGPLAEERFRCKVYIENDCNACALAEMRFGAQKDCRDFLYMTVSNSIGGALCLNGALYTGADGDAGEIGLWMTRDLLSDGRAVRPLEDLASGRGLSENYFRLRGAPPGEGGQISGAELAGRAENGDPAARAALLLEGTYLGQAVARACLLLNPRAVILGGGLSLLFGLYREALECAMREEMPRAGRLPEVRATSLGYDGALLGAAATVLSRE